MDFMLPVLTFYAYYLLGYDLHVEHSYLCEKMKAADFGQIFVEKCIKKLK